MSDPLPTIFSLSTLSIDTSIFNFSATILSIVKTLQPNQIGPMVAISVLMVLCLAISAISSAAENAFFSHRESDVDDLREENSTGAKLVVNFLEKPKHLLATILVANSLVNVAFVLLTLNLTEMLFNLDEAPWLKFLVEAILVTLVILVFGEVIPKVFATQNYRRVARKLVVPMKILSTLLWPLTHFLVRLGVLLEKRAKPKANELTSEELTMAIDMATDEDDAKQEKEILKGIVNMGNIQVKQIMQQRMDVIALSNTLNFHQVLNIVRENGFSRMPVYEGSLDKVIGILNIKTLMPHLNEPEDYNWRNLILAPYFIPENKPMDDTLAEMRLKHSHFAIVVDEFGGTSGIITMEDILEEVFGDMRDEFDEDAQGFVKLADGGFLCEGKFLLVDFIRIAELPVGVFDTYELESDSLGGMISERLGRLPKRGDEIEMAGIRFRVDAADPRKVKKIKVQFSR